MKVLSNKPSLSVSFSRVILALAVVPVLLTSTFLIWQSYKTVERQTESAVHNQGMLSSQLFQQLMTSYQDAMTSLSIDSDVANAARSSVFSEYAQQKIDDLVIKGREELIHSVILDRKLEIVDAYPIQFYFADLSEINKQLLSLMERAEKSYIRKPSLYLIDGKRLISGFTEGEIKDQRYLAIAQPLYLETLSEASASQLTGVFIILLPDEFLINQLRGMLGDYVLLDLEFNGTWIQPRAAGQEDSFLLHHAAFKVGEDLIQFTIGSPKELLYSDLEPVLMTLLSAIALTVLFLMLVSILLSRRLLRPFRQVTDVVELYASGDYQPKEPDMPYYESDALVKVLAKMARRVIHDQGEMETLVNARTTELASANGELQDTLNQLKEMQTHLVESEKMAQLGQLVAGVAHEINTPLGVALTAVSTLTQDVDELNRMLQEKSVSRSKMMTLLQRIGLAADMVHKNQLRADKLIRSFKEVSVDQASAQRRQFNLYEYLQEVLSSLSAETKRYKVAIEVKGKSSLKLDSYPGAFGQIISNLVINSLRHGFELGQQGHIQIHYQVKGRYLEFVYRDDGRGAPDDVMARIFEPFFTTRRTEGGTGLGMHVTYNMVTQKLGGQIRVERPEDKRGIQFVILLPKSLVANLSEPA